MEEPVLPGPKERIGYILDVRRIRGNDHFTVMSAYTTTAQWQAGVPLPAGLVPVDAVTARTLGQKSFVLDARKVAFIPVTAEFFPRLGTPDRGIVHTAPETFHRAVENALLRLAGRPDLIMKLGPDAPGRR
jgi:hypothetical protein